MKSAQQYHKSATKEIRPFFQAQKLEDALNAAQIRLFEEQPFSDATSFTIEEPDVHRLNISVRHNLQDGLLKDAPVPREKLLLALVAANPFLKKTVLVRKTALDKDLPSELEVGSEVLDALGGGANVTLEVALCLSSPLKKEVGKPFLRGHWLSKKTFELRPPKLSEDFDVEPMGDDGWKAMGLPPKTLYHVDYYGYVNEQASKDRQIAKVRIHSDVYKKLTADSATKMNRPLMSFLAAEIPCQILASSVTEWSEVEQPTPRSPLSAFLKRINRIQPCDLKQLAAMAKEPGMPRLRAVLHADQLTVRHIAEA